MKWRPGSAGTGYRWPLYAITIIPVLTAATRAIATGWFPIGDSALLYLRTADVLTRHHPLLGSWSSASRSLGRNINNPGPVYADLIAPFAHAFPPGVGNAIGVAVVNVLCIVLAALAARRIGGAAYETWTLLVSGALAWTMGSEVLFDIFQAHALLFPFLTALVLLSGAMTGHRFTWPWLVAVWSIVLQTHISYAYIGAVVIGVAIVTAIIGSPSPRTQHLREAAGSRAARWSLLAGALLWLQPVVEQFTADGEGNLTRLARSAGGTDVAVGLWNALRMVSAVVALPPWWTRWGFADTIQPAGTVEGPDGTVVEIPWLPDAALAALAYIVFLLILVACFEWARRQRDVLLTSMTTLALAGHVGGVLALSWLTVGSVGLAAHHTRWLFVLALWAHATIAFALVRWWLQRAVRPGDEVSVRRKLRLAAVGLAGLVAIANVPKYTQQHGPLADTEVMPALERVFEQLDPLAAVDPVLYRTDNLRVYEPYSSAIMSQLVDRGIEFRVDDDVMIRQLGPSRRADGSEVATITQLQGWDAYAYRGSGCVLARVSDIDADAERELATLASGLAARAAALDVSAVASATDMTDRDRALAREVAAGDADAIHRAVVEGWFGWWIDHDLVAGDPIVIGELLATRPPLMSWVGSTFVLVVTPAGACDP